MQQTLLVYFATSYKQYAGENKIVSINRANWYLIDNYSFLLNAFLTNAVDLFVEGAGGPAVVDSLFLIINYTITRDI
jgi:hypothetical protein